MIPLAPLGAGDILGGAFAALGRAWKQLLGVSLLVFGFLGLIGGVVLFTGYQGFEEAVLELDARSTPPDTDTVRSFAVGLGALWSGMSLLLLLGTSLVQAAAAAALRGAVLGRTVPFGTVWRQAWSRVWAVAGGNLLVALATVVPVFGLLFLGWLALLGIAFSSSPDAPELPLLPPGWLAPVGLLGGLGLGLAGIWLWVRFSLAPAAVVFEGLGPVAALRRSARLVRGAWWRVFGIALLAGVIAAFATWLLQMPFQFLGAVPAAFPSGGPDGPPDLAAALTAMAVGLAFSLVGTVVAQAVTAPFSPLVHALLYVDRRIRTEDLARSLAEAAARDPWPPYHGAPARRG
ncbi:hypothetical protein AB0A99_03640 [Streptomyces fradiae]|uniref:hypothetical protein n=1 Tax=Streptomyces fradiae TaxID=1906 RepID=UPI0033CDF3E3